MNFKEVRVPDHSVMIEITDRIFNNSGEIFLNQPRHAKRLWRADEAISEKGMRLIDALFSIAPIRTVRILKPKLLEVEVWPNINIKDVLPEIREVFTVAEA